MNEPGHDDDHVPDNVLDELQAAFSQRHDPPAKGYDFDDPSIDRLLGLTPASDAGPAADAGTDDAEGDADPTGDPSLVAIDDDEEFPDDDLDDDDLDDEGDVDDLDATVADHPITEPVEAVPASDDAADAPRRTIVIDHEDVPDTVYLDEELDADRLRGDGTGERSTVVIGDLDDGPPVQQAPVSGSAGIDPRIRARRIATRRAEGRKRLIWVVVACVAVLLVVAGIAIVASPIFDVRTVEVQGAVYTDQDVLTSVVDSLKGEPVLLVDTAAAERTLEQVPWVERARVTTDFPHTVRIDIRERRPVATFQGGDQQFRVIDVQGRVLDVIKGQPVAYPLITGDNPDTERGQFAGAPYASAGVLVLALPPEIRSITRSIGVDSSTGTLSIVLASPADKKKTDIEVRLGDDTALADKLARLLYQVRGGLDGVCSIDVSTNEVGVVPGC